MYINVKHNLYKLCIHYTVQNSAAQTIGSNSNLGRDPALFPQSNHKVDENYIKKYKVKLKTNKDRLWIIRDI